MKTQSTTWKYLRRSPYQSIAAIMTMFVTFVLSGFFALAWLSSIMTVQFFESKPQITIFFKDTVVKGEIDKLIGRLEETGKTASVKYISKEDALEIYKDQNKNDPLLLELVTSNMLPASLEVSAIEPQFLSDLDAIAKSTEGIEEVVYQKDIIESLLSWTNGVRVLGAILGGLMMINAFLIIIIIIGMKIALRKDEIEILQLVGASPGYIRLPFILEGMLYGVIGAGLAVIVILSVVLWFRTNILAFMGVIPSVKILLGNPASGTFIVPMMLFGIILASLGALLGTLGSVVSLRRYLKS